MTFSDIATFAATKIGELDSDTLSFALTSCFNRYRILWNSHDWPEIKQIITQNVPAGATGWFTDQSFGEALNVSWRVDITQTPLRAEYRDLGWIKTNDPFTIAPGIVGPLPRYYWQAQPMALPYNSITSIEFDVVATNGDNVDIIITGMAPQSGASIFTVEDLGISCQQPTAFFPRNSFTSVFSITKANSASQILVKANGNTIPDAVLPPQEFALQFNQYKFFPILQQAFVVDLELKLKVPQVLNAGDTPIIKHLEDALIAFVQSDLLERQRQYQKAMAKTQEAQSYLQAAKNIQRDQADYVQTMTPDTFDNMWRLYWIYPYRF